MGLFKEIKELSEDLRQAVGELGDDALGKESEAELDFDQYADKKGKKVDAVRDASDASSKGEPIVKEVKEDEAMDLEELFAMELGSSDGHDESEDDPLKEWEDALAQEAAKEASMGTGGEASQESAPQEPPVPQKSAAPVPQESMPQEADDGEQEEWDGEVGEEERLEEEYQQPKEKVAVKEEVDDMGVNEEFAVEGTEIGNEEQHHLLDPTEITVITKGTTIKGGIVSDNSLEVMGTINGDVECQGKLTIIGTVKGDSKAAEIYVSTPRLEGSLDSQGPIKIGVGTVVIGDVKGTSAVIAGAVKGNIDVNGPVIIDSTAIVLGNLKAKSLQLNNGAVLEGVSSLGYADIDLESFFRGETD